MSGDRARLDQLIEAVADGAPIDWNAVEAAADARDRRRIRYLRLVADLAQVHASRSPEPDERLLPRGDTDGAQTVTWGHLQLAETIGDGQFGVVYRAHDPWLDRDVAVKLLKCNGSGASVPRILQEARTLARVRHPNVVTVHGADEHDGRVGLTMEWIRGRTLESVLASQGPFGAAEAAVIGHDVCRALAAVHGAGLVHRDVKAANVMREVGGRLVLMDFGAGLMRTAAPAESGALAGTPLYLAPEVLNGNGPTPATDIYAVGVLLFRLVTAEYPVMAESLDELVARHARGEVRRLHDLRPDLDDAFVRVVDRALDPDPNRRYATAGELRSALAAVTGSTRETPSPLAASAAPAAEPSRSIRFRWTRRVAVLTVATVIGATAFMSWRGRTEGGARPATVRMLAVLPLTGLSGGDGYLADGITEALTQELAVTGPLRVVSRTSVARLISEGKSVPDLARTLNADAIVEGSVQRSGEEVRIALRVIHAGTNMAMWANTFERSSENILALEREIAKTVVAELKLALSPETADKWKRAPTVDGTAYDNYLRGRYQARKNTRAGYQAALEYFGKSVATEPLYAPTYVGIAECYLRLGRTMRAMPRDEAAREAKAAVTRALELDETLSSAHSMQAVLLFEFDSDFAGAEVEYQRAVALDPSDVESRLIYSSFLTTRGRFDEAFAQVSFARQLDPLSANVALGAALVMYCDRRYDDALGQLRRAIRLEPSNADAISGLGRVLTAMGRYDEAIAEYSSANAMFSGLSMVEADIAQAELGAGRVFEARRRIARLEAQASDASSRVSPNTLAVAYARLDKDQAFAWLERSFQIKGGSVWLKVDPRFDPLRSDPRFKTFLQRLQLAP